MKSPSCKNTQPPSETEKALSAVQAAFIDKKARDEAKAKVRAAAASQNNSCRTASVTQSSKDDRHGEQSRQAAADDLKRKTERDAKKRSIDTTPELTAAFLDRNLRKIIACHAGLWSPDRLTSATSLRDDMELCTSSIADMLEEVVLYCANSDMPSPIADYRKEAARVRTYEDVIRFAARLGRPTHTFEEWQPLRCKAVQERANRRRREADERHADDVRRQKEERERQERERLQRERKRYEEGTELLIQALQGLSVTVRDLMEIHCRGPEQPPVRRVRAITIIEADLIEIIEGSTVISGAEVPVASSLYRLHTFNLVCPRRWRSLNPGHFSSQGDAEVDRRGIELLASGGCPEFELVAMMAATMAVVPTDRHVDREGCVARRWAPRQLAEPVPLIASAAPGFEAQQFQHLLHRNFRTQSVEVDTRHLVLRNSGRFSSRGGNKKEGPFRSHYLYRERGTVLF